MERQLDPASAAWEPDEGRGQLSNRAARDSAPVGTVGAPEIATVDPRGLVTPRPGGWSLDWWVGADDRWHVPAREVAVRQSILDGSPVVDTAMRVPGGDVVERVWAFADPSMGAVLAVELRNEGRVPVALALAVRPYGVDGAARVDQVAIDATGIRVDGRRAVWLPKPAARVAVSTWADGDVAAVVTSGAALDAPAADATCSDGFAQAAVILPLSHGTSFVVLLPLDPQSVDPSAPAPEVVPPADAVARGWASHRSRAARIVLPDAELGETVDAAVSQLMLAAAGARLDGPGTRQVAEVTAALDRLGLRDEIDPVVASLPEGQRQGGQLGGDDPDPAATGAVLVAAGTHWALGRDVDLVEALAGVLAAGAHHRPGAGRLVRRALPLDAVGAGWQLAGARRVAAALHAIGQTDAAVAVHDSVGDLGETLRAGAARSDGGDLVELCWLGVSDPQAPDVAAALAHLTSNWAHGSAVATPTGSSPSITARLAALEVRGGDRTALDRLSWLVEVAGPERAWPEVVHPRTGLGCSGASWSPAAAAAVVELVLDLLCVADAREREVRLLPVVADDWLGAGIEAHELRTELGVVSFAIRWHGERPALLWEVEPHDDGEIRVTAPGLDPAWSSTELRGDALLAAPVAVVDAADTSVGTGPDTAPDPDDGEGATPSFG